MTKNAPREKLRIGAFLALDFIGVSADYAYAKDRLIKID